MKITEITIRIVPNAGETAEPVTLRRMPDKGWQAETPDGVRDRLFHSEMVLAIEIQEIIRRYNAGGGSIK
jgi:hypothetical protein